LESLHASASEALTLLEGHPSGSELEVLAIDAELLRASEAGGLMLLGRFEEAVQRIDAMLEPTRLARPTRSTIRALGVRALALAWSGSPRASEAAREGQRVLRSFPGTATESLTLHIASAWVEEGPEAEAALESAVAIQTSVDFLYMRVFTELAAARLHLRRGRWALAGRALEAAEEVIAGLREPAIFPDLAKALRAEFDERAPAETLGELSAREIEILTAIADGATRSEAARRLHLSVNTVKTYLRTAYRKLGATDRDNAVASARALGLIGEAPQPEDRPGP
jgi:DNA-binding CsgD family transcriptional regulator